MTEFIGHNQLLAAAVHQAHTALRYGRNRDEHAQVAAQNRMCDTIERAQYPNLLLRHLVQQVGRGKAMVLGVERPIINLALSEISQS